MNAIHKIYYFLQKNSPIRINFILIGLALYFLYQLGFPTTKGDKQLLESQLLQASESIVTLISKFTFLLFLLCVSCSLLSTLLTFFWCKYNTAQYAKDVKLTIEKQGQINHLRITVPRLLHPILGYVSGILAYNKTTINRPFQFRRNRFFSIALYQAEQKLSLEDIITYRFHHLALIFSDMFRMVQLRASYVLDYTYYNPPKNLNINIDEIEITNSNTTDEKIKLKKTNDGDYLNYKNYESGDDIRRIVWKVYAKNKDFIVRTPDLENKNKPLLQILASFYTQLTINEAIARPLLNHYKNTVWTITETYLATDAQVNYQNDTTKLIASESTAIAALITQQEWHNKQNLASAVQIPKDNIIIIHSLSNVEDVEQLIHLAPQAQIYLVQLSDVIMGNIVGHWLRKIFLVNTTEKAKLYSNYWSSAQQKNIRRNEKSLLTILDTQSRNYQVL